MHLPFRHCRNCLAPAPSAGEVSLCFPQSHVVVRFISFVKVQMPALSWEWISMSWAEYTGVQWKSKLSGHFPSWVCFPEMQEEEHDVMAHACLCTHTSFHLQSMSFKRLKEMKDPTSLKMWAAICYTFTDSGDSSCLLNGLQNHLYSSVN